MGTDLDATLESMHNQLKFHPDRKVWLHAFVKEIIQTTDIADLNILDIILAHPLFESPKKPTQSYTQQFLSFFNPYQNYSYENDLYESYLHEKYLRKEDPWDVLNAHRQQVIQEAKSTFGLR